jgi:HTH-type transcriptional regulator, glycine betaine synthesis regulator
VRGGRHAAAAIESDEDGALSPEASVHLAEWEALVVDAVGTVIEFWGFKRSHGRLWALLYLRGDALTALELQELLGASKGAISMITRELEQWGVIKRVRSPSDAAWRFDAETNLMRMVRRVIEDREIRVITRAREDLERAEQIAQKDRSVKPAVLSRLSRMRSLATFIERAVRAFLQTSKLDVGMAASLLEGAIPFKRKR